MDKPAKTYQYFTKAIPLPNGKRKYVRAKTKEELDAKVRELENLMSRGVDIGDHTIFVDLAQTWYDVYKKPNLRL